MKRLKPRQLALLLMLGLSLAATAWVSRQEAAETQAGAAVPAVRRSPGTPAVRTDWPAAAAQARDAWPAADALARAAWGDTATAAAAPPPPPPAAEPAAEEPPAAPVAPPFPYQMVGRLTDSRARAILNNAQRSAVVGVGELVDGQWRVDAIEPNGLRVTFLPLGTAHFIPFAAA